MEKHTFSPKITETHGICEKSSHIKTCSNFLSKQRAESNSFWQQMVGPKLQHQAHAVNLIKLQKLILPKFDAKKYQHLKTSQRV
jgi:hypothetical protein